MAQRVYIAYLEAKNPLTLNFFRLSISSQQITFAASPLLFPLQNITPSRPSKRVL